MVRKLAALVTALCLVALAGFALADSLEDVNICVGQSYSETYYSRGGYIGSAKAANPNIVEVSARGWSMNISGSAGISYGSIADYKGLAVGSTTVTFYSERGGVMGSLRVNVTNHRWTTQTTCEFERIEGGNEYFLSETSMVKTCSVCQKKEVSVQSFEPEEGVTLAQDYLTIGTNDKGEHVTRLQTRLKELGYSEGEPANRFSYQCRKDLNSFMNQLGLDESFLTVTSEAQEILYCPAAPKKDESASIVKVTVEALTLGDTGAEALNRRLNELGYLRDKDVSDKYGKATYTAVAALQMKLGLNHVNGKADKLLLGLIYNGVTDALKISPEEYEKYAAKMEVVATPSAPTYKVIVTSGSNLRTKPSYDAEKIIWVNEGETLFYISEENGWYLVSTPSGQSGYIPADRSRLVEE